VLQEVKALQVQKAILDLQDQKDLRDLRDQVVLLVLPGQQDHKALQVLKASQVRQDPQALLVLLAHKALRD
jgi:hypothetical protein